MQSHCHEKLVASKLLYSLQRDDLRCLLHIDVGLHGGPTK